MNPLERYRIDARLTRQQLAEKSGVPENYLYRIETGRIATPDPERLGALADCLNEHGLSVMPSDLIRPRSADATEAAA